MNRKDLLLELFIGVLLGSLLPDIPSAVRMYEEKDGQHVILTWTVIALLLICGLWIARTEA